MPQISRKVIPKKLSQKMWLKFSDVIIKTSSSQQAYLLFNKLLTKTERIMLSKRLMAYLLLATGWEPVTIAETLKLSTSTIYKFKFLLDTDTDYSLYLKELIPENIENIKPKPKDSNSLNDLISLFEDIYASRQDRSRLLYGKNTDFDVAIHRNMKEEK